MTRHPMIVMTLSEHIIIVILNVCVENVVFNKNSFISGNKRHLLWNNSTAILKNQMVDILFTFRTCQPTCYSRLPGMTQNFAIAED